MGNFCPPGSGSETLLLTLNNTEVFRGSGSETLVLTLNYAAVFREHKSLTGTARYMFINSDSTPTWIRIRIRNTGVNPKLCGCV
jgi:hypothetical protein